MVKNYETDNGYIRVPGQAEPGLPKAAETFFPLSKGSHWDYTVKVISSTGELTGTERGSLLAAGSTKVGGQDGSILQTIVEGKVKKEEVFSVRADGIYLLATGTPNALATLSPPPMVVQLPVVEGAGHGWTGILHYGNSSGFGNALSRISGHAKMVTPAGSFDAYRLDLLIATTVNGAHESLPMTRWVTPGVGIVNQRELSGTNTEIWNLKSRQISPN